MGPAALLILIVVPSCVLVLYYIKTKNAERIKMIEQGINPDADLDVDTYRKQSALRNGVFFIFLSLGLLMGHYLATNSIFEGAVGYISMTLLFGGLGSVINYLIIRFWRR